MATQEEIKREMSKRKTQRQRLLDAFQVLGEMNTREVMRLTGTGVSSRIHELREDGYKIVCVRENESTWRYIFHGKREEKPLHWKSHKMRNIEDVSL